MSRALNTDANWAKERLTALVYILNFVIRGQTKFTIDHLNLIPLGLNPDIYTCRLLALAAAGLFLWKSIKSIN